MAYLCKSDLPKQYDVYPFIATEHFAGKLEDKVVLITGASSGIGRTTALAFAAAGAKIAVAARRKNLLDQLVEEIKTKYNRHAVAIEVDFSDYAKYKSLVSEVESSLGPIDVLVNNAGVQQPRRFQDMEFEEWWYLSEVNMKAPIALTHAVLPSMTSRKTGTIINVSSTSGAHDSFWQTAYSVPKAAMIKFHQNLAVELEPYGILSFSVHPGNVGTALTLDAQKGAAEYMPSVAEFMTPKVMKLLEPFKDLKFQSEELAANTIVTLCTEERCKVLDGRYVDAEQDLEKVLEAAESGRVEKENLYVLKMEQV